MRLTAFKPKYILTWSMTEKFTRGHKYKKCEHKYKTYKNEQNPKHGHFVTGRGDVQNKVHMFTQGEMFTRRHSGGDCLSFTAEGGVHIQTA